MIDIDGFTGVPPKTFNGVETTRQYGMSIYPEVELAE